MKRQKLYLVLRFAMVEITTSLEWAEKLKEAGWLQEKSYFVWGRIGSGEKMGIKPRYSEGSRMRYSAPSAEEILRELPEEIEESDYWLEIAKSIHWGDTPWEIRYRKNGELLLWDDPEPIRADTLANASAAMWIYLKENNLLSNG